MFCAFPSNLYSKPSHLIATNFYLYLFCLYPGPFSFISFPLKYIEVPANAPVKYLFMCTASLSNLGSGKGSALYYIVFSLQTFFLHQFIFFCFNNYLKDMLARFFCCTRNANVKDFFFLNSFHNFVMYFIMSGYHFSQIFLFST